MVLAIRRMPAGVLPPFGVSRELVRRAPPAPDPICLLRRKFQIVLDASSVDRHDRRGRVEEGEDLASVELEVGDVKSGTAWLVVDVQQERLSQGKRSTAGLLTVSNRFAGARHASVWPRSRSPGCEVFARIGLGVDAITLKRSPLSVKLYDHRPPRPRFLNRHGVFLTSMPRYLKFNHSSIVCGRLLAAARAGLGLGVVVPRPAADRVARYADVDRSQMDANALGVLALADAMTTELAAAQKRTYRGRIAAKATRRYRHRDRVIGCLGRQRSRGRAGPNRHALLG